MNMGLEWRSEEYLQVQNGRDRYGAKKAARIKWLYFKEKNTEDRDSKGDDRLKKDARDGGAVAGRTRKDIEKQTKKSYFKKQLSAKTKATQTN